MKPAISVRGLGKAYTIAHQEKATLASEALLQKLRNPFGKVSRETFWALKDVEFDIEQGDVVGIIGRNGAGKSTLLKVLSRITTPTTGEVRLYGRVGSLLEVGTGFHPELTGRENIYLNGAILGMRKSEIDRQFDAIVDFAEVEKFLDTPVKRYSSGMYVRLAFAVAAHLNPEILIVDEVLAVGDAQFQAKCLGKMQDVSRQEGRTVLFVSHNMRAVRTLCRTAILLTGGQILMQGRTGDALDTYSTLLRPPQDLKQVAADRNGSGEIRVTKFYVSQSDMPTAEPLAGVDTDFCFVLEPKSEPKDVSITFTVFNGAGIGLFCLNNSFTQQTIRVDKPIAVVCRIPCLPLNTGQYRVAVNVSELGGATLDHLSCVGTFRVSDSLMWTSNALPDPSYSAMLVRHEWQIRDTLSC